MAQLTPSTPVKKQDDQPAAASGATVTIVINNREALVVGQLPASGKDTANNPILGERVVLIPGLNLVETEKLRLLKENRTFLSLFSTLIGSGRAPEHNSEKRDDFILVEGDELPKSRPFSKIEADKCGKLIKEIFTTALLSQWHDEETRDSVRLAVQRQIERLRDNGAPNAASQGR